MHTPIMSVGNYPSPITLQYFNNKYAIIVIALSQARKDEQALRQQLRELQEMVGYLELLQPVNCLILQHTIHTNDRLRDPWSFISIASLLIELLIHTNMLCVYYYEDWSLYIEAIRNIRGQGALRD